MDEVVRLPLRKFTAPEYVLGTGASALVGSYARKFGAGKVLVVSDAGLERAGLLDKVVSRLEGVGIKCERFDSVSPNPRDAEARKGAERYLSSGCDAVVAVGGGSPMDCAKAIGLMATNGRDVLDFEGVDAVPLPGPPLICVPTTSGTSADISQFAIINAAERGTKIAIVSKKAIPDVALIDPECTVTMPPDLTAATGMDALTHAMEAFVSTAASPVTDLNALEAISLVAEFLPRAVRDGEDREARNGMTLASLHAGLAFSNASLGAVHALAHALGGALDLPHGLCNALLLGSVVDYNFDQVPMRYERAACAMAAGFARRSANGSPGSFEPRGYSFICDDSEERFPVVRRELLDMIAQLRTETGLSSGLGSHGLYLELIPRIAEKAYRDACLATNPRKPTVSELENLYARSL